jgi:hypothetical protein
MTEIRKDPFLESFVFFSSSFFHLSLSPLTILDRAGRGPRKVCNKRPVEEDGQVVIAAQRLTVGDS